MSKSKPIHHLDSPFAIEANEITLSGLPLSRLVARVGQTPFYAYDRNKLSQRYVELRKTLPDFIKLHYAIKANPMPALVQHMATLVDGFDLASLGEMRTALDTPMPPKEISFAGPGKRKQELRAAIAAGVTINAESFSEVECIKQLGQQLSIRPKLALRINPDFELKSSGMKMSGGAKQFGVDAEKVPELLQSLKNKDVDFRGFHIFSGSQNLKAESIIEAQQKTFELAFRLAKISHLEIHTLNIGGGFGIPYFPGETPLSIEPIAEYLASMENTVRANLPQAEIVIELGRYLVGPAGIYVCKIVDKKISRGHTFYITDGGLHHHLAASGNFGQVIRKNYPVTIGNKINSDSKTTASVVGPLCTPLDILADKMELPTAEVDDYVVVFQSGAYGYSASPHSFLSHPEVLEVMV